MPQHQDIRNELAQISDYWSAISSTMPYSIPDGYFDHLPAQVLAKIESGIDFPIGVPYTVNPVYFKQFPEAVMRRIRAEEVNEELSSIAPSLTGLNKQPAFSLPTGYFEQLRPSATEAPNQVARIIRFSIARKWLQYGVAAVMAGLLVTAAFIFTDEPGSMEYAKYSHIDVPSAINQISEQDLSEYLTFHEKLIPVAEKETVTTEDIPDVQENIQFMSDEELKQYMEENTEPAIQSGTIE